MVDINLNKESRRPPSFPKHNFPIAKNMSLIFNNEMNFETRYCTTYLQYTLKSFLYFRSQSSTAHWRWSRTSQSAVVTEQSGVELKVGRHDLEHLVTFLLTDACSVEEEVKKEDEEVVR